MGGFWQSTPPKLGHDDYYMIIIESCFFLGWKEGGGGVGVTKIRLAAIWAIGDTVVGRLPMSKDPPSKPTGPGLRPDSSEFGL